MTNQIQSNNTSFYGLGIAPQYLEAVARLKFQTPTPIQQRAIPLAIEGQDVVGIAQTGTGKTLAFGIPMMQRLAQRGGQGLVLAPTRELALQIAKSLRLLDHKLKMATLIGGASMGLQIQELRQHPRILIATPGRLMDHMRQRRVSLREINIVILDEADRMLDMGFAPQIEEIFHTIPRDRQTLVFSATMPQKIMQLCATYMKLPTHVEIAQSGTLPENVTHELFIVQKDLKKKLLEKLLEQYHGTILLFCRTKIGAKKITKFVREHGSNAAEMHSDRSLAQRREALEGFRSGKYRVLVATDIAARGIDVSGIELVINYDIPDESETYVHRIGRAGRAGSKGHAISFATPEQGGDIRNIESLIKRSLPVSKHPEIPVENFVQSSPKLVFSSHRRRFGRR